MPPVDAARSVELSCYAKVNLALSVGPLQPDGYHPLASWMVAVTFADTLMLARSPGGASTFDITFAEDAPLRQPVDWPPEKDLAFRAHALLEKHAGRALPAALTLKKRIPAGAGLGGGSSDAAAMLVAINMLFDLSLDEPTLRSLAATLGADVGFLVAAHQGVPSALATGRGEVLEPLPLREVIHLVLIFPPFGCPTGEVYHAFDRVGGRAQPDIDAVRALAARETLGQDGPFNDLADPACGVRPELGTLRAQLHQELSIPVHVTGSGSTLFVVAPSAITAKVLARKVTAVSGLPAVATRTL